MRNILLIILLLSSVAVSQPAIGTTVGATVVPTDSTDIYAVMDALWGRDGWRSVSDTAARNAITTDRRREGMVAFTRSDSTLWQLRGGITNADWKYFVSPKSYNSDSLSGHTYNEIMSAIALALDSSKSTAYTEVHHHDDTIEVVVPAGAGYTKIPIFMKRSIALSHIPDTANDQIICGRSGVNLVDARVSFYMTTIPGGLVTIKPAVFVNSTEQDNTHGETGVTITGRKRELFAGNILSLIDGDTVSLRVRHDYAGDITIYCTYGHILSFGISNADSVLHADSSRVSSLSWLAYLADSTKANAPHGVTLEKYIVSNGTNKFKSGLLTNYTSAIGAGSNNFNNDGTASKGLSFDEMNIPTIVNTAEIAGDLHRSITIRDDAAMAAGVGGGIALSGKWKADGSYAYFGGIRAYKANSTEGNYSGGVRISTRQNGNAPSDKLEINELGKIRFITTPPTSNGSIYTRNGDTLCVSSLTVTNLIDSLALAMKKTAFDDSIAHWINGTQNYYGKFDITGNKLGDGLLHDSTAILTVADSNLYVKGKITSNTLNATCAVVTDPSKSLVSSATTSTELGYVRGVTSAIQPQLNAKQDTTYRTLGKDYGVLFKGNGFGQNINVSNYLSFPNGGTFGDVLWTGNQFTLRPDTGGTRTNGILEFQNAGVNSVFGIRQEGERLNFIFTDTTSAFYPNPWTDYDTILSLSKDWMWSDIDGHYYQSLFGTWLSITRDFSGDFVRIWANEEFEGSLRLNAGSTTSSEIHGIEMYGGQAPRIIMKDSVQFKANVKYEKDIEFEGDIDVSGMVSIGIPAKNVLIDSLKMYSTGNYSWLATFGDTLNFGIGIGTDPVIRITGEGAEIKFKNDTTYTPICSLFINGSYSSTSGNVKLKIRDKRVSIYITSNISSGTGGATRLRFSGGVPDPVDTTVEYPISIKYHPSISLVRCFGGAIIHNDYIDLTMPFFNDQGGSLTWDVGYMNLQNAIIEYEME